MRFGKELYARKRRKPASADHRFIHLDGSPYGSTGLLRIATNPLIQYTSDAYLACTLVRQSHAPPELKSDQLLNRISVGPFLIGCVYYYGQEMLKMGLPVSKTAVIDKQGRSLDDPAATLRMGMHYRTNAECSWSLTCLAFTVQIAVFGDWLAPYGHVLLIKTMLDLYASRKLLQRDWVINTNPPNLRPKQKRSLFGRNRAAAPN